MKKIFVVSLIFINLNLVVLAEWFDDQALRSTVLLEKIEQNKFTPFGTGIYIYNYESRTKLIVVTCAHLIKGKSRISVRVNADSSIINHLMLNKKQGMTYRNAIIKDNTVRLIVELKDNYYINPKLDIAAFYFRIPALYNDIGEEIRLTEPAGVPKSSFKYRNELSLGDEVYFVGFPLGYGSLRVVEPIIRSGSIAWLPSDFDFFLLDAFSYGGNSGSPVFQKCIIGARPGDLSWSKTKLLEMVVGHQSVQLKNILNQPDPKKLKFETTDIDLNIGLARCVYIDDIEFVIKKLNKKH